jgi:WhiB family redox-sensing transcriptional regulator
MRDLQWMDDALCRQIDAELFFPEASRVPHDARRACSLCAVTTDCLSFALKNDVDGVWGGTTRAQRAKIRKGAA